jgi:transposase
MENFAPSRTSNAAMSRVRTREPVREQGVIRFEMPEDALPVEHPARLLWRVVETLDLSAFLRDAKAVEGHQGRDVVSVRMLLTLWLYAISVGVGSAREIERRFKTDIAFQWIVGDQRVGRTTLAEFRVQHLEALEKVFTDVLGLLLDRGLANLDLVAQDGTRVRASASAPSFRRLPALEACREQAQLHLKAVLAEADEALSLHAQRVREAKARDYQQRVEDAIGAIGELMATRRDKRPPRASTTDPEARVMKMADGGFRPGYNVQLSSAGSPLGGPRTIVGVRVTNKGSDYGSVEPMLVQIHQRTGQLPDKLLADGGHADVSSIEAATALGVVPVIPPRAEDSPLNHKDSEIIQAWRERMKTDDSKQLLRARASLCELPNAHAKTRFAMASLLVRGLEKVTCVALLTALTHNVLAHAVNILT